MHYMHFENEFYDYIINLEHLESITRIKTLFAMWLGKQCVHEVQFSTAL